MPIRNTNDRYGLVHVFLHWLMAVTIFGTFVLGLWMVELDYYDAWYKKAPDLHRSIGVFIVILLTVRLAWRLSNPVPAPLPSHTHFERLTAVVVHTCLYVLVVAVAIAGYLMSTADGRSVLVFDWFEVPATVTGIDNQEDIAGEIHFYLAVLLIALVAVHGLAALKHHLVDKDATLRRMFLNTEL
ncbi:MAG: cytochrome b [Pseudomonadales bacterium]